MSAKESAMQTLPGPRINAINEPFWTACNRDELLIQQCEAQDCRKWVYFPRVCCPHCGHGELAWRPASGAGRIASYTRIHRPQHPAFFSQAPYYFIAVTLDEGPLMYSRLELPAGSPSPAIGQRVTVVFVEQSPGQKLPFFRPA